MNPLEVADLLGAQVQTRDGVKGTRFSVWAPNASAVSVVGDFNGWDGRHHRLQLQHDTGIWQCFVPEVGEGCLYKYELHDRRGDVLPLKADPLARRTERPPATASIVAATEPFEWTDGDWMATRAKRQHLDAPIAIYEVHLGSWLHHYQDVSVWSHVGPRLIEYAQRMGFTHIELLPITEHPFGGSWGYQPLGMFAPSARWGTPVEFAEFVNACHDVGLAVIMDWVPAHFPGDAHGLANFDGTALYEHADPRQGLHPDWNTLVYNVGRNEVAAFLIASALYWLRHFHVDGLRVDAVASMLYLDYSRAPGEWVPNRYGGRENLEAVAFLRQLNETVATHCPGAIMVAEESTAWPGVTASPQEGGLGFSYKWNMGWMHDTLAYMQHDPIHRRYHHHEMTFGAIYAWTEHFILPLSHDEVVHGKGSLLNKMPGDTWQRFANLRAYYGFMWGHPGKKLLFMGGEVAQVAEWDHDAQLDWALLDEPLHSGVQRLIRDLNTVYQQLPALHANDNDPDAFGWVVGDDAEQSVFAFWRAHGDGVVLVVSNMTPMPRHGYRLGVPKAGRWVERLNTDAAPYGGGNLGNMGQVDSQAVTAQAMEHSVVLTLPPLSTLFFEFGEASS